MPAMSPDAPLMSPQTGADSHARTARWSLPRDRGFQGGLRLAVFSPLLSLGVSAFLIPALGGSSEAGLGWGLLHVAAFGVIEAVWIVPVAAACAVLHCRRFALGLILGGSMLLVANGLAWLLGLIIGAR